MKWRLQCQYCRKATDGGPGALATPCHEAICRFEPFVNTVSANPKQAASTPLTPAADTLELQSFDFYGETQKEHSLGEIKNILYEVSAGYLAEMGKCLDAFNEEKISGQTYLDRNGFCRGAANGIRFALDLLETIKEKKDEQ